MHKSIVAKSKPNVNNILSKNDKVEKASVGLGNYFMCLPLICSQGVQKYRRIFIVLHYC
jgi:hypothetical protein